MSYYNRSLPIQNFSVSFDWSEPKETTIGGKTFKNIGDEEYRIYYYRYGDENEVVEVRIDNPKWLRVTESGSHRIVDKSGSAFYIPPDFTHIKWHNKPGAQRVNF